MTQLFAQFNKINFMLGKILFIYVHIYIFTPKVVHQIISQDWTFFSFQQHVEVSCHNNRPTYSIMRKCSCSNEISCHVVIAINVLCFLSNQVNFICIVPNCNSTVLRALLIGAGLDCTVYIVTFRHPSIPTKTLGNSGEEKLPFNGQKPRAEQG